MIKIDWSQSQVLNLIEDKSTIMGKFVILKRANGEYQFNLKASNGQIILSSEGYISKASCVNGIEAVRLNAPNDNNYERKKASNGNYYFLLKAGNGAVIGTSELYVSEAGRENGIEAVKKNGLSVEIDDYTL
jgi:uncharacterized protein YegP (UPF0339 family)